MVPRLDFSLKCNVDLTEATCVGKVGKNRTCTALTLTWEFIRQFSKYYMGVSQEDIVRALI